MTLYGGGCVGVTQKLAAMNLKKPAKWEQNDSSNGYLYVVFSNSGHAAVAKDNIQKAGLRFRVSRLYRQSEPEAF